MSKSIAQLADEFVLYKHSLGYIYDTQECYLKRYCKFEDSYGYSSVLKKKAVVDTWTVCQNLLEHYMVL